MNTFGSYHEKVISFNWHPCISRHMSNSFTLSRYSFNSICFSWIAFRERKQSRERIFLSIEKFPEAHLPLPIFLSFSPELESFLILVGWTNTSTNQEVIRTSNNSKAITNEFGGRQHKSKFNENFDLKTLNNFHTQIVKK